MPGTVLRHEVIEETEHGPKIVVTVVFPEEHAGQQMMLWSTEKMERWPSDELRADQIRYMVYQWPQPEHGFDREWHGAIHATDLDAAIASLASYFEWLWWRAQVREDLMVSADNLGDALDRFRRGLYENNAIDFEQEWARVRKFVESVEFIMKTKKG